MFRLNSVCISDLNVFSMFHLSNCCRSGCYFYTLFLSLTPILYLFFLLPHSLFLSRTLFLSYILSLSPSLSYSVSVFLSYDMSLSPSLLSLPPLPISLSLSLSLWSSQTPAGVYKEFWINDDVFYSEPRTRTDTDMPLVLLYRTRDLHISINYSPSTFCSHIASLTTAFL